MQYSAYIQPQHLAMQSLTYSLLGWNDDNILVLLGDQRAGAVRCPEHVDDQVVGQDIQLLHLVARHVCLAGDALPGEMR